MVKTPLSPMQKSMLPVSEFYTGHQLEDLKEQLKRAYGEIHFLRVCWLFWLCRDRYKQMEAVYGGINVALQREQLGTMRAESCEVPWLVCGREGLAARDVHAKLEREVDAMLKEAEQLERERLKWAFFRGQPSERNSFEEQQRHYIYRVQAVSDPFDLTAIVACTRPSSVAEGEAW